MEEGVRHHLRDMKLGFKHFDVSPTSINLFLVMHFMGN